MIPLRVPFHQTIQCITSQESNESRNMCIAATDSTEATAVLIKPTDSTTKKVVCRRSLLVSAGASLAIQICGHMLFPYPSLSLPSLNETLAKFVELPDSGGVKFLDLRLGSGSTPVDGDQVSIHYYGRLAAKQGWRFDSTYDHKDSSGEPLPFVFVLGSGKVISGIESAVRSIKVGGIRRVIIPPSQGYQSTTQEPLPPNFFDRQRLFTTIFNPTRLGNGEGTTLGTLIFDIELVNFHKLRLPQKFGMKYGEELRGAATLVVPTGESRSVELIKENDSVWLSDGWKEFVEYFNIGYTYFLLFTYEGNLGFKVNIFDPTSCEVSYPSHSQLVNQHHLAHKLITGAQIPSKEQLVGDRDSDDSSVQVLTTPFTEPNSFSNVSIVHLDSDDEHDCVGEKEVKSNDRNDNPLVQEVPVRVKNYEALIKAVTAAGISIPKNPFFIFLLKPYVLHKGLFIASPSYQLII